MTQEERTTTTTSLAEVTRWVEGTAAQVLARLRETQRSGSPHTEAALIRAHAALEDALRHLQEAEAPWHQVTHEGQPIPVMGLEPARRRVQDLDDPSTPPQD